MSLITLPELHPIRWAAEERALDLFTMEVLKTLTDPTTVVWYPLTAYNLRMVAAARRRIHPCSLLCRTDPEKDRLYVRANLARVGMSHHWARLAARRSGPGKVVLMAARRRRRRAA